MPNQETKIIPIPNPIESARSFETAIEIIPENECIEALARMQDTFRKTFPDPTCVSVIPILMGGKTIGDILAQIPFVVINPMRMSYYDGKNERLSEPTCIQEPNIKQIIQAKSIVFAEAVVDSQGTILKAIEHINALIDAHSPNTSHPEFHTFTLVSKINGSVLIPNLTAMFSVHPDIWVHGWGCDNGQKGREETSIKGVLSPFAKEAPYQPYYQPLC